MRAGTSQQTNSRPWLARFKTGLHLRGGKAPYNYFVTAMPQVEYTRVSVRNADVYPDSKAVRIQLTWNKSLFPPVKIGT